MSKTPPAASSSMTAVEKPNKTAAQPTVLLESDTSVATFRVAVSASLFKTATDNPDALRSIMESYAKAARASSRSGESSGFSVVIDPAGHPEIAPLPPVDGDPLAAARRRGREFAATVVNGDDMLSGADLARRLGVTRMTINTRRQKRELLALEGAKRGLRFPAWQIDASGRGYAILPELFACFADSDWAVYRFLTQRHDALGGRTAKDALRDGADVAVLDAAKALADGSFA